MFVYFAQDELSLFEKVKSNFNDSNCTIQNNMTHCALNVIKLKTHRLNQKRKLF